MSNIFFTFYIKIKKVKVVIKYENLLDYGNLSMIIHIDVYL